MSSCFVIFAVLLFLFSLFMEIAMQRLWTAKMHKMKIEQVTTHPCNLFFCVQRENLPLSSHPWACKKGDNFKKVP